MHYVSPHRPLLCLLGMQHPFGMMCTNVAVSLLGMQTNPGADPEKLKERWLKWCAKAPSEFLVINYSLGRVNCFVSIHVLLHLSVFYHHHKENEASYAV